MKSIGSYELIDEQPRLGEMTAVYQAREPGTGRTVALKVLHPALEGNPQVVARFRQEAKVAAGFDHSHIVRVWQVSVDEPPYYLALEWLPGGKLSERLRNGPLTIVETLRIIRPIGEALDAVHPQGVVHRDINPSSIMFDGTGRPVLTDFSVPYADDLTARPVAGSRSGTAEYMSPEQAEGKTVDWRSDLYSLAAVVYHMVAGRPPFHHNDPLVTMNMIVRDQPPRPSEVNPALPSPFDPVLMRGLAKDPAKRYQSAGEFVRALTVAQAAPIASAWQTVPRSAPGVRPARTGERPTVRRPSRRRFAIGGSLLLVVGALLLVTAPLWRRPGSRPATPTGKQAALQHLREADAALERKRPTRADYESILKMAQAVMQQYGSDPAALNIMTVMYVKLHQRDRALEAAKRAVHQYPDDAEAWANLAFVRAARYEPGQAAWAARKARQLPHLTQAAEERVELVEEWLKRP